MNAAGTGAGAGHATDERVGRDRPDQASLRQLAEEQAALRRVATLVAHGATPEQVFAAVTEELARLVPVDAAAIGRYEPDGTVIYVASWGKAIDLVPVGSRWTLDGTNPVTTVFETGRPARVDSQDGATGSLADIARDVGVHSRIVTPVVVEGRLWGLMGVGSTRQEPLPPDAEARLASFTELVATAIANADSRAALARMAEEQAALRRVATMVARGAAPEEVFAAVTEEFARLAPVDVAAMSRLEPDGTLLFVTSWGRLVDFVPVGSRWTLDGTNLATAIVETGRPLRLESQADATGSIGDLARRIGLRSAIGTPIVVEGRLWGQMGAGTTGEEPLPPDAEARLASFTELVAMAIANADGRAALVASRARIVAAADETRRQIQRDLHDGTQQQLVTLMLDLQQVQEEAPPELQGHLSRIAGQVSDVLDLVRKISRGIHPAILSEQGLTPALRALARRSAVPVELDLRTRRPLPAQAEVTAYYAVSEALANAAKHAHARAVHIELDMSDTIVWLAIRDDGIGGADAAQGSGLTGLRDRIEAVGGTFDVTSPAGGGTTLLIEIPV